MRLCMVWVSLCVNSVDCVFLCGGGVYLVCVCVDMLLLFGCCFVLLCCCS